MITSKQVEKLENSSVKLSVTVPKEEVRKRYDAMIVEYANSVRIDGFRKGHVPSSVLERKFGDELRLDAMGRVLEAAVQEAVEGIDEKPLAYASPTLDGEPHFSVDEDFSFSVIYDVFPTAVVADWKGIVVDVPQVDVSPADEERELAEIRERNAIVVEKTSEATAAKGDVVTLAYHELDADDAIKPGSERQDFTFEIGTGYNLYKFDDDIVGMKRDEEKSFEKSFPADYEYAELAGKTVKVGVKVAKIKEKKLPELDDEFAQDVSEKYKNLADLRAAVRSQLDKRLADKLRQLKEKAVVDGLLERTTVSLPNSMVEAELGMRLENLMRQMGLDSPDKLDRLLSYSGKTREALVADWRPSAERAIKTRLVLEKLAEEGKYECSEADLESEYARQAAESSLSAEEVKAEYQKRGQLDYLKDRLREDKLMDDILASAKIGKGPKVAFVDLLKDNE